MSTLFPAHPELVKGLNGLNELKMTDLQSDIWQFLLEGYVGIENATPRAGILARFNLIKKKELSDRVLRAVVSDLLTDFKKAICTTPEVGYYVARANAGRQSHADSLFSR